MSRDVRSPEGGAAAGRGVPAAGRGVGAGRGVAASNGLAAAAKGAWRSPVVRLVAGLAVSAAFLAVTVSRVDLGETARALANAAPGGVLLAIALVLVELTIRAERWRILLHPSAQVPLRSAFAYLTVGYFANTLLPARLGDAARAYLAARSFGISSLVTLGTVVVERVTDTAVILLVVLMAGLAVAPGSQIADSAAVLTAVVLIGLAVAVVVGVVVLRSGLFDRRYGRQVRAVVARVAEGAAAVRRPRGAALVLGLTILPFGVGVCTFGAISGALSLPLESRSRTFRSLPSGRRIARLVVNGSQAASLKSRKSDSIASLARPIWSGPPPSGEHSSLVKVSDRLRLSADGSAKTGRTLGRQEKSSVQ